MYDELISKCCKAKVVAHPQEFVCSKCGLSCLPIMKTQKKIITQLCESCHNWVDQRELVWDLEESRLICLTCQKSKD